MKKNKIQNSVIVYHAKNGAIELRGDVRAETVWASLNQIANFFDTDKSGVSRHVKNIFESGELAQNRTVANFETVQNGKWGRVPFLGLFDEWFCRFQLKSPIVYT